MSVDELRRERQRLAGERLTATGRAIAVIGPPCSGKTTYVREHAGPEDVVVDVDALARALGSVEQFDHDDSHLTAAVVARDAVVAGFRPAAGCTVWIIATDSWTLARIGAADVRRHVMGTPLDECERRAVAHGRSEAVIDVIRRWQP